MHKDICLEICWNRQKTSKTKQEQLQSYVCPILKYFQFVAFLLQKIPAQQWQYYPSSSVLVHTLEVQPAYPLIILSVKMHTLL